jgi:hypothetical protein
MLADAATTLNIYGHWIEASDQAAAAVLDDLLGKGDKAPTSPSSEGPDGKVGYLWRLGFSTPR